MVLLIRGNLTQSLTQVDAIPDGNVSYPGLKFAHDQQSGLYRDSEGNVGISVEGSSALVATSNGVYTPGNITASYLLGNGALLDGVTSSNASSLTEGVISQLVLPQTLGNANTIISGQAAVFSGNVDATYYLGNGYYLEGVFGTTQLLSTTIINSNESLESVTLIANSLVEADAQAATRVYQNGLKLAYISEELADYSVTSTQNLSNVTTEFNVTLTNPLTFGEVLDIVIDTNASVNAEGNGEYYGTVYANTLEVNDISFGGNSVLANTDIEILLSAGIWSGVDGNVSVPSFTFESANSTGMYLDAPDTLGFTANGQGIVTMSPSNIVIVGNLVCDSVSTGNTSVCFYVVEGTHGDVGTSQSVSLPSGVSPSNVLSFQGYSYNTNGDMVPFMYGSDWLCNMYVENEGTIYVGVDASATLAANKNFKITIMANT